MEVKCPGCGKPAVFEPSNPYRPFCSERCKLIDLGAWAEGKYAVPAVEPPDEDELEALLEESAPDDEEPEDPRH
jgi:endogenous inhibitor of DNA gyrase (YacG/DUF329 family)